MRIETPRFGTLDIPEEKMLEVAGGIVGFPAFTRFFLIDGEGGTPFKWLQSVDEPALAFVVIDPKWFHADYYDELPQGALQVLGISRPQDLAVLALVTIPEDPREMTANLKGPLVFNAVTRKGVQLVLDEDHYSLRHRILPEKAAL